MTDTQVSIYGKLLDARAEFHQMELKKTGWNPHAKFSYFELGDFLKPAMACLNKQGLVPVISFTDSMATMLVYDRDSREVMGITSPMVTAQYTDRWVDDKNVEHDMLVQQGANLRACHPIQNLGAVETYCWREG
jgi:hypothetical protein